MTDRVLRALRLGGAVRPDERERFLFFFSLTALVTLAQTVGLAGSEALFLSRLGVRYLPHTFVLASLVTVLGSMGYAWLVGRARNDRVFAGLLALAALAVAAGAAGAWRGMEAVLPALLCAFFLCQAVFVNHFWTFVGDFFDTLAAKRLFPLFTVGASLGGFAGGLTATVVGGLLPAAALITAWAVLLVLAALLIRMAHGRLRRWGPLELEEEDETSVSGLRGAAHYMRGSALGRWLVISTLAMVTALLVVQFLYSDVLARRFPSERDLALVIAVYLAVSNLVEIAVEIWLTPWLIARLGVGSANLVHPVLTLLSFALIALDPRLPAAILARSNRELLENATANPVRNLLYNALPLRLRGRVRALLEGIVMYAGMSLAGIALLATGPAATWALCAVGAGLALVYLLANLRVRDEYLRTLVSGLRSGRLELTDVSDVIGPWGAARLASLWQGLLDEAGAGPPGLVRQLAPLLVEQGQSEPVVEALSHPNPSIRAACARALARVEGSDARRALASALGDPEIEVRRAAVASLGPADLAQGDVSALLEGLLRDPDPQVRATAAARAGPAGAALLREMTRGATDEACAALDSLPRALWGLALDRAADPEPLVRAAAYRRLAAHGRSERVPVPDLARDRCGSDPGLRRAAAAALAARPDRAASEALALLLDDPLPDLRSFAVASLGERGEQGAEIARALLRSDRARMAEGAMRSLAATRVPYARAVLLAELRHRVRASWTALLLERLLEPDTALAPRFLRRALGSAAVLHQRLAFVALGLVENPSVVNSVERALRFGGSRSRADALEVLTHLGDRESAALLVLLLEQRPIDEKLTSIRAYLPLPEDAREAFAEAGRSGDRWLLAAEQARRGRPELLSEDDMERLLSLGRVPLFFRLSLEQLEALNRICREVAYVAGEVVLREGDPGAELYVVMAGEVDVVKSHGAPSETLLNRLGPGSYFGEMAILDGAPRSASIVVRRDARMIELEGVRLKELMLEMPEIAFEIVRVLTSRLRSADRRLQELVGRSGSG